MKHIAAALLAIYTAGAEAKITEACNRYIDRLGTHVLPKVLPILSKGETKCWAKLDISKTGEITGVNLKQCPEANRSEAAAAVFKISPIPMPDDLECLEGARGMLFLVAP